ncbi:hypothetical protein A4H97_00050 [Niastella yeongjuensis]|uniref:Uncharacterized protein n=1 Tax=Niastella yeongjuensis TaxID=354355 RepID=A0A1V9EVT8_9BACT|nr:hypothetical protein [Niastella yeongjuensis]OQP50276.1 hypothetical protein A4H97_00050 [Niastella yeongjuensis]SEN41532.1 hypothetical protein SAMN05660816_00941 [Niastella yeongjuensis]
MKHIHVYTLLFMFVFCTSCRGQNKPNLSKEKIKSETKEVSTSRWSDTKYEYTDSVGKRLIIQNGFPRGERYTDPNGKEYLKVIFWTRLINETDNPLELKIDFPADSFEVPWLPGKYYKILLPPDTMTIDKEPLYDYGLTGLKSFLDAGIHKPSSLQRTINPKESNGFYVVILSRITEGAPGALRTGLSLKGQDLFYRVSLVKGPSPLSLISEKEIHCGSINLKNLILPK